MWKKTGNPGILIALLAVMAMGMTAPAAAIEPNISVSLDRRSVLLGDSAILSVAVKNGDAQAESPQLGDVPGCAVKFRGVRQESSSRMTVIVQGKKVEDKTTGGGLYYDYELVPQRPGVFDVEPIPITYAGRVYRTEAFTIEVLDQSEKSEDLFLTVMADPGQAVLGQKIRITFKWYFRKNVTGYRIQVPWLDGLDGFLVSDPPVDPNKKYYRLQVNGSEEVMAEKRTEFFGGNEYAVVEFSKVLTPLSAGRTTLEPTFLKCDVVTGYRQNASRGFFDDFFDRDFDDFFGFSNRRAVTEPFATRSGAVELDIREVPAEGRPVGYTNAVGQFDFGVDVSPLKVKAGDPVTVTTWVSGRGNAETLDLPVMDVGNAFKSYEAHVRYDPSADAGFSAGKKLAEQVFVPREAGVFEIPEVAFSYFDPVKGRFETIRRGPFRVTAEKAPEEAPATMPVAVGSADESSREEPKAKARIHMTGADIRYIKSASSGMRHRGPAAHEKPWVWAAGFVLPAVFLGLLAGWIRSRRRFETDPAYRRGLEAGGRCLKSIEEARSQARSGRLREANDALMKALTTYAADRLGRPGGLAGPDLWEEIGRRIRRPQDAAELGRILKETEDAVFGAAGLDAEIFPKRIEAAAGAVRRVERSFR
ncbi:MAG: protein BatD [Candidatus Omnitrophica bacterium]|nr:protein BatD [Candidatus Omnitrophota bacterium]